MDELTWACARQRRTDAAKGLVVMDLDHLELVGDRVGHLAGDRVRERVGAVVFSELRATEPAGHMGGGGVRPGDRRDVGVCREVCERLRRAIVASWSSSAARPSRSLRRSA